MMEPATLSKTIASTETMKLAGIPEPSHFRTPIEERFERITRIVRHALDVPVAAITFINRDRQWFKSVRGWTVTELPLDGALCTVTFANGRLTVVPDTLADPATRDYPCVISEPCFRAYAAHPLFNDDNRMIGTLCVFDHTPRQFSPAETEALVDLAAITQREIHDDYLRNARSELAMKLAAARREAMIDPLTRLWNRRGATVLAGSALEEARAHRTKLAVGMLDLDNFKQVNDTYGHQTGDEVLRKAAGRLIRFVRTGDTVCRIGGDEFLLLMTEADIATAEMITECLRVGMQRTPIATRQGQIPMSVSIGYTLYGPDDSIDAESLIERADQALMAAKKKGRNRVRNSA